VQNIPQAALPLPPLPPGVGPPPLAMAYQPGYAFPQAPLLAYGYFPPAPVWRVWTVFVAFGIALIVGIFIGGIVPVGILFAQNGWKFESFQEFQEVLKTGLMRPSVLLSSGATTQFVLLITALAAAMLSPVPFLRRLRLNPSTLSPVGYIIAPIGALSVSFLFSFLVGLLDIHNSGTLKMMGDVFKQLSPGELVIAIIIVGIAPGFAEEFLFRGYMQTRLSQRMGRWAAILITAVLFGLMHMDPLQSPFALGFGIYLGYLAEKSGSIRPTMLCHAVNNSIQVLLGWLPGPASATESPDRLTCAILALVAAGVLALCVLYIKYKVQPPPQLEVPPDLMSIAPPLAVQA
jgi:membrane protease YdiL (CAAX protease family)